LSSTAKVAGIHVSTEVTHHALGVDVPVAHIIEPENFISVESAALATRLQKVRAAIAGA
jgi:hypothetical protein